MKVNYLIKSQWTRDSVQEKNYWKSLEIFNICFNFVILYNIFYILFDQNGYMVDLRKGFSLISSWDHCHRSSPSRISDMPWAGFEPAQYLSSGLVEWSCAIVITTSPWPHFLCWTGLSIKIQRKCKVWVFLPFYCLLKRLLYLDDCRNFFWNKKTLL